MSELMTHKAGYVGIIGKPNAGKSTLMNALLGQKLSITTPKPQTTRKNILGILSEKDYQIVFLDTPGILKPGYLLQEKMAEQIQFAAKDADIIVAIFEAAAGKNDKSELLDEEMRELLSDISTPVIALLNKIDLLEQEKAAVYIDELKAAGLFTEVIPVSAEQRFNLDLLLERILEKLPEHPKYYPDDIIASENERFFVTEFIREQIFNLYKEEVPYSTEVIIEEFKERETAKDYIRAAVIVERDSQKSIIIGKKGEAIKRLGEAARKEIEAFLDREVFLELRVKVKEKWRSDENMLKYFGYNIPKD